MRLFSTSWEKSESGMESLKSLCTKVSKWVSGQNDKTTLVMCRYILFHLHISSINMFCLQASEVFFIYFVFFPCLVPYWLNCEG